MSLNDLSDRLKNALPISSGTGGRRVPQARQETAAETMRLRAKMLGVLMRDARLNAGRTVMECARVMQVPPQTYEAYEYGDDAPALPQLELLAYTLGIPVSHFWGRETLQEAYDEQERQQRIYLAVRARMVGVLLRAAREDAGLSLEAVAAATDLDVALLREYELGERLLPLNALTMLALALNKGMEYFAESGGNIGRTLAAREAWQRFAELPEEVRSFAANPTNVGFMEIAMMLSQMPTDTLRRVGASMLDITL